jgi:hypothetical protein
MPQIQHPFIDHLDHRNHVLGLALQGIKAGSLMRAGTTPSAVKQVHGEDLCERVANWSPPRAVSRASVHSQQRRAGAKTLNADHGSVRCRDVDDLVVRKGPSQDGSLRATDPIEGRATRSPPQPPSTRVLVPPGPLPCV